MSYYEVLGLISASHVPLTPSQIVSILDKPKKDVEEAIKQLEKDGKIKKVYVGLNGCYKLV